MTAFLVNSYRYPVKPPTPGTPPGSSFSTNMLLVGGGGGGSRGGGGGAGGFLETTATLSVTDTYSVTVGIGGANGYGNGLTATNYQYFNGVNGGNTSISGPGLYLFANGGGGGGGTSQSYTTTIAGTTVILEYGNQGNQGGSGGGGGLGRDDTNGYKAAGGAGSTIDGITQGKFGGYSYFDVSGGTTNTPGWQFGGGGGGANTAGGSGGGSSGGAGGGGKTSNISGSSVMYAGGGGGGTTKSGTSGGSGGVGGGGNGGSSVSAATAGTNGLGGGGGAVGGTGSSARGGSGVFILAYPYTQCWNGGTVTVVGAYTIHTFTANGTLSPL